MSISFKSIGLLLGPLLFLIVSRLTFIEALSPQAWGVLGVGAWMITWWITEATPMAVAALLPIVVFPALGVFELAQATAPYASPVIFLFMGGFFLALGLEEHGLHRRIALNLVRLTGTSANGIVFGFMLATAFLSMWISNTATTVMMLPIATSVTALIRHTAATHRGFDLFALSLMLGIAYAANIGGMATIIGTPPNVVFAGYASELLGYEIDFARWMAIGLPISGLLLLLAFWLLTGLLYRSRLGRMEAAAGLISTELDKMGPISRKEKMVAAVFGLTAFMWIFKRPVNSLLGLEVLNDTATAILGGILMFALPVKFREGEFLLPWEATKRLPWGILLLFGGGMTLARGMETTGLIHLIAEGVSSHPMSAWLVFFVLIGSMLFLTELMSNVALATIYIPVVIGIAHGLELNPLVLSIPVTMAASCAFMMPISTPPNAIVFASGHIRIKQMIRAGFLLNVLSVLILTLASFTLIEWVFGS